MRRRIAITGASGNLGTKLGGHLRRLGCEVTMIDREGGVDLRCVGDWKNLLLGIDCVFHFAAQNPFPEASWHDSACSFDITANVFAAAVEAKVRRIVFASSNHVMGGWKEEGITICEARAITTEMAPFPGTKATVPTKIDSTPYATAKLFGERLANTLSVTSAQSSFISLRIGWCQPGENDPSTLAFVGTPTMSSSLSAQVQKNRGKTTVNDPEKLSDWYQLMWLSNRDFLQICSRCITATLPQKFCVLNAMSNNSGMRWDLKGTKRILGYVPQDDVTKHLRPDGDLKLSIRSPVHRSKL